MKEITLNNTGNKTLVDDEDYEKIAAFGNWYETDQGYAMKKTRINGKNISLRMHTLVNNTPHRLHTDHINGNRLDNQKLNLRTVSQAMNTWNQKERKSGRKYDLPVGVTYDYQRKKFIARRVSYKRFNTKEEAIKYLEGEQREWK